ncbi:MAG: UDP-N-acetylglucosamine 2-epimerase (non-hydrolyzing) [Thermoplasmata archaeon]
MKILTIVGARPQFVKAFVVSRELRKKHEEVLVHTGQHYDENLSKIFFDELEIPKPDHNLGIGSRSHGFQTAEMIRGIEDIAKNENPDIINIYGDTNSTLSGAIVGSKLESIVAHVEAGLRSFNRDMPEEINRVLTDHASDLLFAPSETAVNNLKNEGITKGVHLVGDVMFDAILWARDVAAKKSNIMDELGLEKDGFILSTVHRAGNTDDRERLAGIMKGLSQAPLPVVLPIHPRTEKRLKEFNLYNNFINKIRLVDPVSYLDFVKLLDMAKIVATDSGGIQKEAFSLDTPCITLRDETEWVETVRCGWNILVGANTGKITDALNTEWILTEKKPIPYGDGNASKKIVEILDNL